LSTCDKKLEKKTNRLFIESQRSVARAEIAMRVVTEKAIKVQQCFSRLHSISSRYVAAIYWEWDSSNPSCIIACQKYGRLSNVVRVPNSAQRLRGCNLL
jgi:hypothetical protein